jgi:hypothetical protein
MVKAGKAGCTKGRLAALLLKERGSLFSLPEHRGSGEHEPGGVGSCGDKQAVGRSGGEDLSSGGEELSVDHHGGEHGPAAATPAQQTAADPGPVWAAGFLLFFVFNRLE